MTISSTIAESQKVSTQKVDTKKANAQKRQQQLLEHLHGTRNIQELTKALEALLTPAELQSIATRLEIARLLKAGITQREIAKQLGVGIATVTRGSRELKAGRFKD